MTSGNLDSGIITGAGAHVVDCKAGTNTKGIVTQSGSTIRGCMVLQNSGDGIAVTDDCTVQSNNAKSNFLARDAAGIHASGTNNAIKENTVLANDMGLLIDAAGNFIIQNTASNNSVNYRIIGSPQSMGPILSGTLSDLTNPIANYEF